MKNKIIMFWAIVILTIISIVIIKVKPIPLGLDLVGGSRIVLEAQTTENISKITQDMMDGLKTALENTKNVTRNAKNFLILYLNRMILAQK